MKTFHVGVKAVIIQDDKVLLLQKNTDTPYWEVPGGRIDGDETIMQTLDRELHEELPNITDYKVDALIGAHRLDHDIKPDLGLCLLFYKVTASFADMELSLSDEHSAFQWVNIADASALVSPEMATIFAGINSN